MVENDVNEPKPKKYCLTYYEADDRRFASFEFFSTSLPSPAQIEEVLDTNLPERPPGGWYMMETIDLADSQESDVMSKEMPCGHIWLEFVSCDTEGGTFMCGVCEPIGKRIAQLLAERSAFKLLYTLSSKPVDVPQEEIVKAHQIVNAHFKAERDAEKDLSASEALEQIGEIPSVQEAYETGAEKCIDDPYNMKKQIKRVMEYGPTRVMFNTSGDATTPERAKRDHNVVPDVIFIRKDGWSIGAPDSLVEVARQLYPNEWVGSFRPQDHVDSEV